MKPEKNHFFPDDSAVVKGARLAVDLELKKKQALSQPIAQFDQKTGKIFMIHADGTRTFVGNRLRKGRYSERKKEKT